MNDGADGWRARMAVVGKKSFLRRERVLAADGDSFKKLRATRKECFTNAIA